MAIDSPCSGMNGFGLKTMFLLFLSLFQKKQLLTERSAMMTFQQSALQQDLSKALPSQQWLN